MEQPAPSEAMFFYYQFANENMRAGSYYVASVSGVVLPTPGAETPANPFIRINYISSDGGSDTHGGNYTLEAGDWVVVNSITGGDGTTALQRKIFTRYCK